MKIAIVHDWLTNMGGAERIIILLHEIFPDAPIYTSVYKPNSLPEEFRNMDIRPTFIQYLPFGKTKYQAYLPLMPYAFEHIDLTEYDLVISSSSSCAKGIITRADTLHICYCNTPMRYAWDFYNEYTAKKNWFEKILIAKLMHRIRQWDRLSADRVDYFIANSDNVARRIKKHYRRDSKTIYPPIKTEFYAPANQTEDYYLVVSRLVPYKRVDLAVLAFNDLGLPLKIIGNGSEFKSLKKLAKSNIEFLGRLSDIETRNYYSKCKAFVFCGEEDFGITPLEAQASGRPVVAFGKGGALETVVNGKTGVFFMEQNAESLKDAICFMDRNVDQFQSEKIREHALKFDENVFKKQVYNFIVEKYHQFQQE